MGRRYFRYIDRQIRDDRRLINNVKCFPVIYDVSNPFYKDGSERKRIWDIISANVQSTAKFCEERWNRLVEMYRKCQNGTFNLHDALFEIMNQFLNVNFESTDDTTELSQIFCEEPQGAASLYPEDLEDLIDLQEIIYSQIPNTDFGSSSLPTDSFSKKKCKEPYCIFPDMFETDVTLDSYFYCPHSI